MRFALLLLLVLGANSSQAASLMCALFEDWDIDNLLSNVEKTYPTRGAVILSDKDEVNRNPRFFFRAEVEDGKLQSVYLRDVVSDWHETKYRETNSNSEFLSVSYFENSIEYSFACWNFL